MQRQSRRRGGGSLLLRLSLIGGYFVQQGLTNKYDYDGFDLNPIVNGLPPGFVFGTASAAYQVEGAVDEGGRGPTIWDTFSHLEPPKVARGENGDIACDSYHRYAEDADLAKAAGFEGFRMSIAWSRIYPEGEGDEPNAEGIQHYHDVIDALLERDLEPMITLYHWDLPQALEDKYGGWLSPAVVPAFEAYADTCFKEFGGKVKKWITINEPWSFVHHGYSSGMHAPGRCSDRSVCDEGDSFVEPYVAGHNVLNAHARAVSVYRTKYKAEQGGMIGMTLNADWPEPLDPDSEADKATAKRFLEFQVSWWADPVYFGDYPSSMKDILGARLPTFTKEESTLLAGSNDFFGLNHYTTWYFTDIPDSDPPRAGTSPAKALAANITLPETPPGDGWLQDIGCIQTKVGLDGVANGVFAETDWLTVVPDSFRPLLVWVSSRYGQPVIMITENGVDRAGEADMPVEDAVKDDLRQTFYQGYLMSMVTAIVEDAVDVRGYYAWSILDNFEWSDGYVPRFGLTHVDYDDGQERTPKETSYWFARLAEARQQRLERRRSHHGGEDIHEPCVGGSVGDGSSASDGDGGGSEVEMAAGRDQDVGVGVSPAGPQGGRHHGGFERSGAAAGFVVLFLVLAVAIGWMWFGVGKNGGQQYEGMDGLSRMSNRRVFACICLSFVLGASFSFFLLGW